MTRTGVHATPEQLERMKAALNAPAIMLNVAPPRSAQQVAHECALEQGLPEIPGYYGCDLTTGEFVKS